MRAERHPRVPRWSGNSWTLPRAPAPRCSAPDDGRRPDSHRADGQREEKGTSGAELAVDPDAAPVRLDGAIDDGEPDACAGAGLLLGLPEPVEEVGELLRRETDARVRDPKHHLTAVGAGPQRDAALSGELH